MSHHPLIWSSALTRLQQDAPAEPVLYFSPETLLRTARDFAAGFPGLVSFAVKANDTRAVLENLITAGIQTFDVASPAEIRKLRAINTHVALHYNNPVRSPAEIAQAVAANVTSYSVDTFGELEKLIAGVTPRAARTPVEVAVRLRLPVQGGVYDFGEKFGADPDQAQALLSAVQAAGFTPSITFHPGTQCAKPAAWVQYIDMCAAISRRAGVPIQRLNVGGGFAANRGTAPDLNAIFAGIKAAVFDAFGADAPALLCEPGRALVAEAFVLAVQIKSIRAGNVMFINDGIYGSFGEAMNAIGVVDRLRVVRGQPGMSGAASPVTCPATSPVTCPWVIYGPTCDSLDRLPGEYELPQDLAEGDYLIFEGMGAYSTATTTRFNGYGATQIVTVQGVQGQHFDSI